MPTQDTLYQEVLSQIHMLTHEFAVRRTSVKRLALLVVGIICAESCVMSKMSARLCAMGITSASAPSIVRRLRRTLKDGRLDPKVCYEPIVRRVIDWKGLRKGSKRILLIVDESGKEEQIHLFRVSLAYRGTAVPLVWAIWYQNKPLEDGAYWANVDGVLKRVATLIPPDLQVIVTADRAYDNPPFVDRIVAYGWHWLVRVKIGGSGRFLDRRGRERVLGEVIRCHITGPGMRWKTRGRIFKKAGWRKASVVVIWAAGQKEPLAVISDLPARWELLAWYGRRFWIESSFRNDKKRGWQWEDSQSKGIAQHQRLLLGMAWATLIILCLGATEAKARLDKLAKSSPRTKTEGETAAKPEHARESLFTMGLRRTYYWLYRGAHVALQWLLPGVRDPSWCSSWQQQRSRGPNLKTVPP